MDKAIAGRGIKTSANEARNNEMVNLDENTSILFKVTSEDTGGALAIMLSANNVKASGPPLHVHPDFDEIFYVTEGEMKFQVGDEQVFLKPGDNLFIPKNVPHAFTIISDTPASFLVMSQPAGQLENFFREYSKVKNITPDIAGRLMAEHNMIVVGGPVSVG